MSLKSGILFLACMVLLVLGVWVTWAVTDLAAQTYRWVFLLGFPAGLSALSLWGRRCASPPRRDANRPPRRLGWFLLGVLAFILFVGGCAVGYLLQWTSFTYGDQQTGELLKSRGLWLLIACLAVGIGWEQGLRRGFVGAWQTVGAPTRGYGVAALVGLAVSLPWVTSGIDIRSVEYFVCGLVGLCVLEWMGTALALRSGGILCGGLLRGLVMFTWGFVLADWYSVFFTTYTYVTTGVADYGYIAGGTIVAGLVVEAGARWLSR